MTLVVDNRAALAGQAGLHVFIVGVSAYPHLEGGTGVPAPDTFGMSQLSSPALTAFKMYRWLLDRQQHLPVPLATIQLLLSPSPAEIAVEPALAGLADGGTLQNFLVSVGQWRTLAGSQAGNMTWFYFAGHGVQRSKDDAVLLLEDFGDGIGGTLHNTVDVSTIFNGMAGSATRPHMAQTQVYFVDACRNLPAKFKNFEQLQTSAAFDVELSGRDERTAPIFYAAVPDSQAIALRADQTLFGKALLQSLNGAAGDLNDETNRWQVTVFDLSKALTSQITDLNKTLETDQDFTIGGLVKDAPLHFLDGPPQVDLVLEVDPDLAHQWTRVELRNDRDEVLQLIQPPLNPHPYHYALPAGIYRVSATIDPPNAAYVDWKQPFRQVMPPQLRLKLKVTP